MSSINIRYAACFKIVQISTCSIFLLLLIQLLAPDYGIAEENAETKIIFSHRLHLEDVGAECTDCHTGIAESNVTADDNRPDEEACLTCHDGDLAPKKCETCHTDPANPRTFADRERIFLFNHQVHLSIDNLTEIVPLGMEQDWYMAAHADIRHLIHQDNNCTACHRGMESMETVTASALPAMDDCLICHQADPPESNCKLCHRPDMDLRPVTHSTNWIDVHQETVSTAKGRCFVCHANDYCWECH